MKAGRAPLLLCLTAAALLAPTAAATLATLEPEPSLPVAAPNVPASVDVEANGPAGGAAEVSIGDDAGVSVTLPALPALPVALPPVEVPADDAAETGGAGGLLPASLREDVVTYAAPAAGTALAVGLGALLWRALAALLYGMPLFSRIERGQLLDNPVRARIHEAIAQEPGLSLSAVAAQAGVAWGTAVHHLRRLEGNGLVVSTTQRGHRRFFIANTPVASQRSAVAVVMHPTARRIAELVSHHPGIDQTGICNALRLNNPAASKHLGQFEQQGLVLSQRSGRSRLYHPTSGLHSALVLLGSPEAPASLLPAQASAHAHPVATR